MNSAGHNATPNSLMLADLGPHALTHILRHLSVQDIANASQACKALHHAASNDQVWHAKALELYPEATVHLGPPAGASHAVGWAGAEQHSPPPAERPEGYSSYRELVRDDNALHASLVITLDEASCDYKYNRPDYYFECCLVELQWNRAQSCFRLFIDSRGEADLRPPSESSMGVTVHRGGPSRRALLAEVARLEASRAELREIVERRAPLELCEPDAAERHDATRRALATATARLQRAHLELREEPLLCFADLVSVARPLPGHSLMLEARPGHYRGFLEFGGLQRLDWLASELPDSYASKREALRHGLDLCFCYANPVPVMPHTHMVDYHSAVVVAVPPGDTLAAVFRRRGRYVAHDEPLVRMRGEGPAEQRRRWQHVRRDVLERTNPLWYVE